MGATGLFAIAGLIAQILVGLKNKSGQPVVSQAVGTAITSGEELVTSVVADIQAAQASGATSLNATIQDMQTLKLLVQTLQQQKILSPATAALIPALGKAIDAGIAEMQQGGALPPIPNAV